MWFRACCSRCAACWFTYLLIYLQNAVGYVMKHCHSGGDCALHLGCFASFVPRCCADSLPCLLASSCFPVKLLMAWPHRLLGCCPTAQGGKASAAWTQGADPLPHVTPHAASLLLLLLFLFGRCPRIGCGKRNSWNFGGVLMVAGTQLVAPYPCRACMAHPFIAVSACFAPAAIHSLFCVGVCDLHSL